MAELTKLTGTYIRSGSIPTTALSGGVVSSSLQVISALPGGSVSSSAQVTALLPAEVVSSSTQVTTFLPAGTVSSSTQLPSGIASSSAQVIAYLPTDTVSSSQQVTAFLPVNTVSSSGQVSYTGLSNIPSGIASSSGQIKDYLPVDTVSSSAQVTTFLPANTVSSSGQISLSGISGTTFSNNDFSFPLNVTVNGLLTATSQSIIYITSSQLNVGSNDIILNTSEQLRYGGLTVFDSGSANQSGSLFWDSLHNVWLYVHAGTSNTSSIVITGPENTGVLGSETFLTPNLLPKAGLIGDHIVDSQISDNGTTVGMTGNLSVTGSLTVATNALFVSSSGNIGIGVANTSTVGARVKIATTTRTAKFFDLDATGGENWIIDSTNTAGSIDVLGIYAYGATGLYIKDDGNVGIGTVSPTRVLTVYTSGSDSRIILQNNGTGTAINNGFDITMGTDGVASVWNYQNSYMRFATNNTERMRIDAAGSLLVGGTSTAAGGLVQIQSSSNTIISVRSTSGAGTAPGIRFYHDTNDEFVIRGGDGLRFFGSGVNERVVITGAGNVGIGTTNPGYKLDVRGEAVLGYVGNRYVYIDSNANVIARGESGGWAMAHAFRGSANTDRGGFGALGSDDALTYYWIGADFSNPTMVLTSGSAGNVGINTTSPSRKLVVYGTSDTYVSIVGGTSSVASLLFGDTSSDSVGRITYNNTTDSFSFLTNSNDRMFISGSGNVGINTTSPGQKLSVEGSGTALENVIRANNQGNYTTRIWLRNSAHSAYWGLTATDAVDPIATGMATGAMTLGFGNNYPIQFWNGTTPSVKMTILHGGNVGIGTTNPFALLHVKGTDSLTANTRYFKGWIGGAGSWGANSYEELGVGFSGIRSIYISSDDWDLAFSAGTSTTFNAGTQAERMRIKANGNVGIGTTNPGSYKLQVQGDTYVTGTLTEGSSIALKKNINPITDALNIINNLTGYTFDRTDSDATNQAGLIAEEVAEVLPGVVSRDQEGNPSGVQYTKIIAYLVESIKELKSELDELKSR